MGPGAYIYEEACTTLDLNFTYEFHKHLSFFANARNVLNARPFRIRYGPETPDYAQIFRINDTGVQFTLGIRGTF